MKKIIIFLLIFILCIFLISCGNNQINNVEEGAEDQIEITAPSSSINEEPQSIESEPEHIEITIKVTPITTEEPMEEENDIYQIEEETPYIVEETYISSYEREWSSSYDVEPSDGIPLDYDEQQFLMNACEEFGVPYALALGLIEKETNFRNVTGDGGNSYGYMQIQQRYHTARMEQLGVTDLMDPEGNFRVGLDYLSELYDQYGDWGTALTAYNMGHDPGYLTDYAYSVLDNSENWQSVIDGE